MKQKIKNLFQIAIFFFGITLLIIGCSKDSIEIPLSEMQKIKKEFSLENFKDDFVKNNLVIDWRNSNIKNSNDSIPLIYEFNTSFKVKNSLEKGKQTLDVQYKLLVSKGDTNTWSFEIIKFLPNKTEKLTNISYFTITSFSGTLYHYNLKGENIKMKAYKNGKLLNEFSNKNKGAINITSKVPPIGSDPVGFWVYSRTQHFTDWYRSDGSGGWNYTHSVLNYTTSEYVWVSTGSGSNDDYHNHYPHSGTTSTDNHPVEVIVNLTGKALCVYNKLNALSLGFKDAIKKFDGTFPVSHLKFGESTNLASNINAETSPPLNYLITITMNSNNLNRPNLSIARTIIHETIHAEMFRKILSIIDNGGDLNGLTRAQWTNKLSNGDYPGIFDYYSRFGVNGMQHQQMAAHYVTTISSLLKELQPGLSQTTYDSLAWEGLKNTLAWDSLSISENTEITDAINEFNLKGSENCN